MNIFRKLLAIVAARGLAKTETGRRRETAANRGLFAESPVNENDIVLYDARGHGYTDPPPVPDSNDAMTKDLAELILELKIQNPIIMGHSMGSITAAQFAARYPSVPRAVILEDPANLGSESFWATTHQQVYEGLAQVGTLGV